LVGGGSEAQGEAGVHKEKIIRQSQPGELHVVLVKRQADGLVGIVYTRSPMSWLVTLSNDTQLAEVEVRVSPAAERIVTALRARFEISHEPNELLPWFLIDFAEAVAALSEYNLRTGGTWLKLELHAQVYHLVLRDRGTIIGLIQGGTFCVKLDGCTPNVVTARRDELKPIVRTTALATTAS
jgi:hypothetical protein